MLPPSRLRRDEMTETAAQESHGGAFPDRWNGCVKASGRVVPVPILRAERNGF